MLDRVRCLDWLLPEVDIAVVVALAAWAYSSTANTTIWRSLELINAQELNSQNSLEVEPAADDAWQCTDDNITANTADWSSLELM